MPTQAISGIRPKNVRKFGWAPETPSIKDWLWKDSPYANNPMPTEDSPDRRELGHNAPVTDQGDTGSCVGQSSAYAVEYLTRIDRDAYHSTMYSALFQYYVARTADGPEWAKVDSGAYIRDSLDCLRTIGIAPASNWPFKPLPMPKKLFTKPSPSVYKAAARWKLGAHWRLNGIEEVAKAIAAGLAVVGGLTLYSSFEPGPDGICPMPTRRDDEWGGHALYFDRVLPARKLVRFQNSWTDQWGERGYGYIPYDYVDRADLADDFWAMQCEAPETTPWKD